MWKTLKGATPLMVKSAPVTEMVGAGERPEVEMVAAFVSAAAFSKSTAVPETLRGWTCAWPPAPPAPLLEPEDVGSVPSLHATRARAAAVRVRLRRMEDRMERVSGFRGGDRNGQ